MSSSRVPKGEPEIGDDPVSLIASSGADTRERLADLEIGVGALLRQLAEAKLSAGEGVRAEREQIRQLLLEILDVDDAFERVLRSIHSRQAEVTPTMKSWIGNFRAVRKLLEKMLRDRNVIEIQNLEMGFNPRWHKAVEVVSDPEKQDGTIAEELRRGWLWEGQILRKSEVVVVRNTDGSMPDLG